MLSSCSTVRSAAGCPSGSGSSNQTVLPRGVRLEPQAALNSPTSCSPRPPSSVSRARRRRGWTRPASHTSHTSVRSRSSLSRISPSPYRRALVTSSLTRSSVVSTRSSRSQAISWLRASSRARPTDRGSRGSRQSPTASAGRPWIRAISRAMSSSPCRVSRVLRTWSQTSSRGSAGSTRALRRACSPSSSGWSRDSTSPSV